MVELASKGGRGECLHEHDPGYTFHRFGSPTELVERMETNMYKWEGPGLYARYLVNNWMLSLDCLMRIELPMVGPATHRAYGILQSAVRSTRGVSSGPEHFDTDKSEWCDSFTTARDGRRGEARHLSYYLPWERVRVRNVAPLRLKVDGGMAGWTAEVRYDGTGEVCATGTFPDAESARVFCFRSAASLRLESLIDCVWNRFDGSLWTYHCGHEIRVVTVGMDAWWWRVRPLSGAPPPAVCNDVVTDMGELIETLRRYWPAH